MSRSVRFITHNGLNRGYAEYVANAVEAAGDVALVLTPQQDDDVLLMKFDDFDDPFFGIPCLRWHRRIVQYLKDAASLIYVMQAGEHPNAATVAEIRCMGALGKPIEDVGFFDEPHVRKPRWRRAADDIWDVPQPGPEGDYLDPPLALFDVQVARPPLKIAHPANDESPPAVDYRRMQRDPLANLESYTGTLEGAKSHFGLDYVDFLHFEQMILCQHLVSLEEEADAYEAAFVQLAARFRMLRPPRRQLEKMFVYFAQMETQGPGRLL